MLPMAELRQLLAWTVEEIQLKDKVIEDIQADNEKLKDKVIEDIQADNEKLVNGIPEWCAQAAAP